MRRAGDVCFSQVFREGGGKMIRIYTVYYCQISCFALARATLARLHASWMVLFHFSDID